MGVTLKEKRERFLKSLKVDQDIKEMLETIGKEYERQGRVTNKTYKILWMARDKRFKWRIATIKI